MAKEILDLKDLPPTFSFLRDDQEKMDFHCELMNALVQGREVLHNGNYGYITAMSADEIDGVITVEIQISYNIGKTLKLYGKDGRLIDANINVNTPILPPGPRITLHADGEATW